MPSPVDRGRDRARQAGLAVRPEAGMAAIGKHYPGHGYVEADSHTDIPVDNRSYDEIYNQDMQPFIKLADVLDGVMPAHVIYSKLDKNPSGFSDYWINKILRNELHFDGVVFSDDLNMKGAEAIGSNYSERALAALSAGCDMVLICNNRAAALEMLDGLQDSQFEFNSQRLSRVRSRKKHDINTLMASSIWTKSRHILSELGELGGHTETESS